MGGEQRGKTISDERLLVDLGRSFLTCSAVTVVVAQLTFVACCFITLLSCHSSQSEHAIGNGITFPAHSSQSHHSVHLNSQPPACCMISSPHSSTLHHSRASISHISAVVVLVAIIALVIRLMYKFSRTRPKIFLFDDLLTVLTYGPLYNAFCDDAYTFTLIPIFLNFIRGIAFGAVQPSGIAQLVLLAIYKIIFVLTINTFPQFPTVSSMNLYHTLFSTIRFFTILLSIAFVPSLGVGDSCRGWISYAILLVYACVLIFRFFLNTI